MASDFDAEAAVAEALRTIDRVAQKVWELSHDASIREVVVRVEPISGAPIETLQTDEDGSVVWVRGKLRRERRVVVSPSGENLGER